MRKEKRLSQTELAERLNKPQSYVSKFESGERKLDLPELGVVTEALGCSLEALIRLYKKELG